MALSLPSDALPPGKASILFWASWHEPSVQMKEVVEALAEDVTFKIHIADPEERPNAAAAAEIKWLLTWLLPVASTRCSCSLFGDGRVRHSIENVRSCMTSQNELSLVGTRKSKSVND